MGGKVDMNSLIAEVDRQALDGFPRQAVSPDEAASENAKRTTKRIKGINWRTDPISVDLDKTPASLSAMDQYIVMTQMGDGYPRQPRHIKRSIGPR